MTGAPAFAQLRRSQKPFTANGSMLRSAVIGMAALLAAGCSTLPPGTDFPKTESHALPAPAATRLGRQFETAASAHGGKSGFRLVSAGVDGFLMRAQMIDAAERSLDLEYFIFRQDETGQLLTDAALRAADRGVRVRVLVDDGDTLDGDERVAMLGAHPNIEIRIFNPFAYRGHVEFLRAAEFLANSSRLDYRMHNKLMVVDNSIALVGGRNIGDQYFQVDPALQFGDDDVFAAGPVVRDLSRSFDAFWNSALAIPVAGLAGDTPTASALGEFRATLADHRRQVNADGVDYGRRVATGEPFNGILSGGLPLVWAHAVVVYDSPEKKRVENGDIVGRLMHRAVADAAASVQHELLVVTPYLIPGDDGVDLLTGVATRGARVRVLTNSLESSPESLAQAGYMHYRIPLLDAGIELYEVRAMLGNARGSGETTAVAQTSAYALHAKLFVFDRRRLYVGSMNFDERSHHLNTEIGLIIDSPELAQQVATRFAAIVAPENSYQVILRKDAFGAQRITWHTRESGQAVDYDTEPARSAWQRWKVELLSLLPLDREL